MKLVKTKDYLLLIDEEVEIKTGVYILEKESIINVFPDYLTDLDECKKIIAYYPLNSEAKELDLSLLPNPFKDFIMRIALEKYPPKIYDEYTLEDDNEEYRNIWIAGYKAAQAKQFTLDDVKKAIEMARMTFPTDKLSCDRYSTEHIVQTLSTQQLPKEFVPEYEYYYHSSKEFYKDAKFEKCSKEQYESIRKEIPTCPVKTELKTMTNSEGREELVGTYKY